MIAELTIHPGKEQRGIEGGDRPAPKGCLMTKTRDVLRDLREAHASAPLSVPCPVCKSDTSEPCRGDHGRELAQVHPERCALWKSAPDAPALRVTLPTPPWAA
ncbi:zinc finger domain-containing protein [Mangrovicoccus algicola]